MPVRKLNLAQMVNLNFGALGVQFAWALQIANMSGIYAFLGAKDSDLGLLWLAFPITGMTIQPLIGYLSDRTRSSYGKRLPYIFWGAIATALSLLLLPNASSLIWAVLILWLFTLAINGALQPFRSLVADVVTDRQRTTIYAVQAGMIGVGATLASLSTWIFTKFSQHQAAVGSVPNEVKLAFYLGAVILIISNVWTVITSRKYTTNEVPQDRQVRDGRVWQAFFRLPRLMRQISYVQFVSWLGFFSFMIYFTLDIDQNIFGLSPGGVHHGGHYGVLLENAVVLTGVCSAIYTAVSVVFSYCIPGLSARFTRKIVHIAALTIGGLALIALHFFPGRNYLFIAMIGVGITWASVNSIPFAMVASVTPKDKTGFYMGLFNVAICMPQLIIGLLIGYLLKDYFHDQAAYIMMLAGGFFLLAAGLTLLVHDGDAVSLG